MKNFTNYYRELKLSKYSKLVQVVLTFTKQVIFLNLTEWYQKNSCSSTDSGIIVLPQLPGPSLFPFLRSCG